MRGKFTDGIFMIANYQSNSVRIKDSQGNTLTASLYDPFYAEYYKLLYECYESTYYPKEK